MPCIRVRSSSAMGGGEIRTTKKIKMLSKSLSRRLERLETTVMPTSIPVEIILQFFSPEKVVTSSMTLEVDLPAPPAPRSRR